MLPFCAILIGYLLFYQISGIAQKAPGILIRSYEDPKEIAEKRTSILKGYFSVVLEIFLGFSYCPDDDQSIIIIRINLVYQGFDRENGVK